MPTFLPFIVRDCALVAMTVALLVLDAGARARGADDALSLCVGVAAGAMLTLSAFLAHEWGHWLGAVGSGGRVVRPARIASFFLFYFDTGSGTRRQFVWMSLGGYLASIASVIGIALWADVHSASGLVALGLTTIGVAVTLALEVPTTVRVLRGAALPTGGVYVSS